MHRKGDFQYSKSLDESGIRCDSRSFGKNYDSTIGSYKDQFSNFEAALFGQGSDRILNYSDAHWRSPQSVARKQRYHGQNSTVFGGAVYGARTVEKNFECKRRGKVLYEKFKNVFNKQNNHYDFSEATVCRFYSSVMNIYREKPWASFLAGALAGVTSQTMTYPLDLMRARMAVTLKAEYKTLRQAFSRMYKEEGILASYRGFTATILGAIPYAGCSFFTYDMLRNLLSGEFPFTRWISLTPVDGGGACTHIHTHIHIQYAKKRQSRVIRMRVAVVYDRKAGYRWGTSGAPCFPWYWDGTNFNSDARQARPAAYFEVLRASCSMMATCRWTVYTVTIPGFSTSLICGGIAGMVGQTSSYPLDIVRRRMQTSAIKGQHYHTVTSTIVKIYTWVFMQY